MAEPGTEQSHREQGHVRGRERSYDARCPRCGRAGEQGWAQAGEHNDHDWWVKASVICFDPVCRAGASLSG